ncbi:MAG TPA: hypothetical protein VFI31_25805 [Pirellulales bacterium]|nr:hypothetical protein [Pirellulales bacterium]
MAEFARRRGNGTAERACYFTLADVLHIPAFVFKPAVEAVR